MRSWADRLFWALTGGCAAVALALLAGIVGTIVVRGLPALDLSFLLSAADGFGGGIRYQLLGTALLLATALAVAVPLAVAAALVKTVYLESPARPSARRRFGLWLYAANGVPSIDIGIFGLLLFVKLLGWGKSWLAGGILLGLMIVPTVAVALVERIEALPRRYLEAAAGLGLDRDRVVRAVILPQTAAGLASGALLGLARAAGETAPILFAAAVFSGATLPDGVRESPVLALPYHIFVLAQDTFDPGTAAGLWGAAAVLVGLVLALSLAALPARLGAPEEARHG